MHFQSIFRKRKVLKLQHILTGAALYHQNDGALMMHLMYYVIKGLVTYCHYASSRYYHFDDLLCYWFVDYYYFYPKNNKHLKRQNRSCNLWTAVQCRWLPLSFCLNGRHPLWHLNWLKKRENASCWHILSLSKDAVNIFLSWNQCKWNFMLSDNFFKHFYQCFPH